MLLRSCVFCLYEDLLASVGLCPVERKTNSLQFAFLENAVGARGTMCPPLEKCLQHGRITGLHTIDPFFVYSLTIPPPFYRQGNGAFLIKALDSYIMCIYLPPYCDTIIKKRSHGQKEFLHFVAPCKYFDQIGIPPVPKHGTGGIPYILTFFEKESLNTCLFIFFTL